MKKLRAKICLLAILTLILGTSTICAIGVEAKARKEWEVSAQDAKMIDEEEAKQIIQKQVPDAKFIEFKLDLDEKIPEYEAKLVKGKITYEISINAVTGEITDYEMEEK